MIGFCVAHRFLDCDQPSEFQKPLDSLSMLDVFLYIRYLPVPDAFCCKLSFERHIG